MRSAAEPADSDRLDQPAGRSAGRPLWRGCSWRGVGWWLLIAGLYLLLARRPVYHTDIWGHLAYGRWIAEHKTVPASEPLMPLATGVAMVDTAWLSQVIGYGLYHRFGVTAVQFLYAAPTSAAFAILLWGVLRRTGGSVAAGLVALLTLGWVGYQQLLIVRPQLNGLMLFVTLLVLLNTCGRRAWWSVVPLMFVLWANLHGSWIVGLGLLAAMCGGHAIDILRRSGSLRAAVSSRQVQQLAGLCGAAALAVLLNPYGGRLYAGVLGISGNPNLQSLIEWQPLTLRMSQGRATAAAVLALMVAYRLSPRRIGASEVLLLAGLGAAALWSSRMLHWWAPVAAWYLALHTAAIIRRYRPRPQAAPAGSVPAGLVGLAVAAGVFVSSPFGLTLLRGQPQQPSQRASLLERSTSPRTPLGAARYLGRHPPAGLVFASYEWGDYLQFAGPRRLELFTNSHAHLIPRRVWRDMLQIDNAQSGWQRLLDEYRVTTIVLNRHRNRRLERALRREEQTWEIAREDPLAIIFRRRSRGERGASAP